MIEARIRKRPASGKRAAPWALDLELLVPPGVTALFGPSGAGKTLLLDCLAGFVRPEEGRILVEDRLLFDAATGVHLPPERRRCGYLLAEDCLFPHLTLRENLAFAIASQPRLEQRRRVNEILERWELSDSANRRPAALSPLDRKRGALARALLARPAMLLLDDPCRGLEAHARAKLLVAIREESAQAQLPVLLATSHLNDCLEAAAEMALLAAGRILARGAPRRLLQAPPTVEAARLLGIYNILEMEIVTLDPQRKISTLRFCDSIIRGPYFPGRLKKDRVLVCIRPDEILAMPREATVRENCIPCQLRRLTLLPHACRLEFDVGLTAHLPLPACDTLRNTKDWQVELAPEALRLISGYAETV